ncbi:DEAD/DEAH box helicase family protein [bacterium]|nr:DEAD/DEAH box helicase family protein [candidate division CSSED10-310 bacterium]
MARARAPKRKKHAFRNELVLNQYLIGLFGIDPLAKHHLNGKIVRPFHVLADKLRDPASEALGDDNLHRFYHILDHSDFFIDEHFGITRADLRRYEDTIAHHTQTINRKRRRPIKWKYFQWLSLLFVEIYLDRYFTDRRKLLKELNEYVARFNGQNHTYDPVPGYEEDDLNKLCLQCATGGGKTLLMHVNILQYRHHAERHGRGDELSRIILLTPNESLTEQHLAELRMSGITASRYIEERGGYDGLKRGLQRVDGLEITKLADEGGPTTVATSSFGDRNLLLVDEGHRGMSGTEEGAWITRRNDISRRGFTFEYSATFAQAVAAAKSDTFEHAYAKSILFDYSYRWFYEDGFGKDYRILNLPRSFDETTAMYLTACLLKYYQQLRIYEEETDRLRPFNLEKPLWVFVGNTVSKARKGSATEKAVVTDVARIVRFIASFHVEREACVNRIQELLYGTGQDTGLLDHQGVDIFGHSFGFLAGTLAAGETVEELYRDIMGRLFHNAAGGRLVLERIKGDSGEILLKSGTAEQPFGLINVGDAKGLCDHIEETLVSDGAGIVVEDSEFSEAIFASVKDSRSPVNLLIGSKKFVEGWDCWRVSTMGLMHVGKSEGAQIIQLFGRGVRLKGFQWSLKRSGHTGATDVPANIEEIETLNIFGIEADFMEKFRAFLQEEGLPGNERLETLQIPLEIMDEPIRHLKMLRVKKKRADGRDYDFRKDGRVPAVGDVPEYLRQRPVEVDLYASIRYAASRDDAVQVVKSRVSFGLRQLALLDYEELYFSLEQYKRERGWYNLNISPAGIKILLSDASWYHLYMPEERLTPASFEGVRLLRHAADELLKKYCRKLYNYQRDAFLKQRMELQPLSRTDDNFPPTDHYHLVFQADDAQLKLAIHAIQELVRTRSAMLKKVGDLSACVFGRLLYLPMLHVRSSGALTVAPVALNDSEYLFVKAMVNWYGANEARLEKEGVELFLLRNLSRGKGVGFHEASNFHPDFILWMVQGGTQYVTFIEPHGLVHEGPDSEKIRFHETIKSIEARLGDPHIRLNSFILSLTDYPQLQWDASREELKSRHVLFMTRDESFGYIGEMVEMVRGR